MSDQALLSEVRANLPIRLAVKAADSLWSGDHLLYTNVPAEVVRRDGGGGGHGGHHGGRRHRTSTHHSEHHGGGGGRGGGGGGQSAIDEAKSIVDDALKKTHRGGKGRHGGGRNRRSTSGEGDLSALRSKVDWLVEENEKLHEEVASLRELIEKLAGSSIADKPKESAAASGAKKEEKSGAAPAAAASAQDEDFDLFGSESEDDEEKERVKQERLKAYAEKKAKKPGPIAKSNIIYDVKPWDDEVDLKALEQKIRDEIKMDGLVWGAAKILPIAFGINKLQIMCVVEDDKVSSDDLEEQITGFEDFVQSVDVVAFNKV